MTVSLCVVAVLLLAASPRCKAANWHKQPAFGHRPRRHTSLPDPLANYYHTKDKLCTMKLLDIDCDYMCDYFDQSFVGGQFGSNRFERNHLKLLRDHAEHNCLISYGEWHGPVALFWLNARRHNYVQAFEPDPMAFGRLHANLASYGRRARVHHMCVNADGKKSYIETKGYSSSKLLQSGVYAVSCVSYEQLRADYPECSHKVDVEGFETVLIDHIIEDPPPFLSLSVHSPFIAAMGSAANDTFYGKLSQLEALYASCVRAEDDWANKSGRDFFEFVCWNRLVSWS